NVQLDAALLCLVSNRLGLGGAPGAFRTDLRETNPNDPAINARCRGGRTLTSISCARLLIAAASPAAAREGNDAGSNHQTERERGNKRATNHGPTVHPACPLNNLNS